MGLLFLSVGVMYLIILIPPCFLGSFITEVVLEDELEKWYEELARGKLDRILFIVPHLETINEKEQSIDWFTHSTKLTRENLKVLRENGLIPVLLPTKSFKCRFWYVYPLSHNLSKDLFINCFYHQSAFISHQWARDGTWHGARGWQFHKIINFLVDKPKIKYVWVDGLCAPQEQYIPTKGLEPTQVVNVTMVVIDHLSVIIDQCQYVGCIDGSAFDIGSVAADRYLNRVWCLYELFLGYTEHNHKFAWIMAPRCKRAPRTVSALFPEDFQVDLQKNKSIEKLLESLFSSFATEAKDQRRIIYNVLGVGTNDTRSNQSMCLLWWNRFIACLDSYPCSYSYFPLEKIVALHVALLKAEAIFASSEKELQSMRTYKNEERFPYNLAEAETLSEKDCGSIITPQLHLYSKLNRHQHFLGFDSYSINQLFLLPFLQRVKIFLPDQNQIPPNENSVVCSNLAMNVFGIDAVVTINCCLHQNTCFLRCALQDKHDEAEFQGWCEWNQGVHQIVSKCFWYSFLISNM